MILLLKNMLVLYGKRKHMIIKSFVWNILNSIFATFNLMALIIIINEMIKSINGEDPFTAGDIWTAVIVLLISLVGRIVCTQFAESNKYYSSYQMGADVRMEIGNKLRNVPMGYFTENSVGEVTACLTTVLKDIETMGIFAIDKVVSAGFESLIISIFLLFIDYRIGLLCIVGIVVGFLINKKVRERSLTLAPIRQEAQGRLVDSILEFIQGASVIKVFGRKSEASRRLEDSINDMQSANYKLERGLLSILPFFNLSFKFFASLIVLISAYFMIGGSLSLANAVMLILSNFLIYQAIEIGGNIASVLRLFEINIEKIQTIQHLPVMETSHEPMQVSSYDIVFDQVDFSYDQNSPTIQDVSFTIPNGTTTAIVGPSGSGKTTICNLMTRFWDVDAGSITIGGKDIKTFEVDQLLSSISMVFQKVYLFEDTVANNIRFGFPQATMEEIVAAAKRARCHDFIMKLPEGYDTVIKEGGSSLSGGEKQRISIARAMIKDAPIVILDEATSSVDPENERLLLDAIEELSKGKTKIMIAHRLGTVRNADQILVVRSGSIEQRGTHDQLMSEGGTYRNFIDKRNAAISWTI